jgi:hypothetical protein
MPETLLAPGNGIAIDTWEVTAAPVPEPATLALAGLGGLSLLLLRAGNNPAPLSPAPHRKVRGFVFKLKLLLRLGPRQSITFGAEKDSP